MPGEQWDAAARTHVCAWPSILDCKRLCDSDLDRIAYMRSWWLAFPAKRGIVAWVVAGV